VHLIRKWLAQNGILVLTYDYGPSESLTPKLLDILRSYQVHATFFLLGSNSRRNPTLADQIINEGHEAGCHTDQHLNAWKITPSRAIADINAGYEALSRWVRSDGMFRPPYGKITLPTCYAIWRRGANISWWTVDSRDTRMPLPSPGDIVERVIQANGGIVLLHDLGGSKIREDFVCETTIRLLEMARKKSLRVMRLSDLSPALS
jgi:peptidoglycan/xylan/chitin deacetylase (PgdA/CDA1 family)